MNFNDLKTFDWRSLKRYTTPKAAGDLNDFLESLPQNTGQTPLIIAAVVWSVAALMGLYTTVQVKGLTDLRAELQEVQALKPAVPVIVDVKVNAKDVQGFVEQAEKIYTGLDIRANGADVTVSTSSTTQFGQFREAIGHVQNGGSGWRVSIDKLCVGRECSGKPLSASLKINKVSVNTSG